MELRLKLGQLATLSASKTFLVIVAAAFIVRAAYLWWEPDPPELKYFNFDEADYELLAKNVYEGNGYCYVNGQPSAFRAPLYPFVIAATYEMVGERSHCAVRWLQVLLSALTAGLVFSLGHMLFGRPAGVWAGIIFTSYPKMLCYVPKLLTETLFIALLCASLAALVFAIRKGPTRYFAVAGAAFGLAFLCRSVLLPFLSVLLWPMMIFLSRRRVIPRAGPRIAALYLAFAAVISPWVIRNYVAMGEFIPTDTHLGWVYWHNTQVHFEFDADFFKAGRDIDALLRAGELTSERLFDAFERHFHFGIQAQQDAIEKAYRPAQMPQTETQVSRFFLQKSLEFYWQNKLRFVRDRIANFINFWMPLSSIEGRKGEYLYAYGVIAIFAAIGLYFAIKKRKIIDSLPLFLIVLNFWAATTLIVYHSRLKMPADIVTIVFAGLAADTLKRERGLARLSVVALLAIATNIVLGLFMLPLKQLIKTVF